MAGITKRPTLLADGRELIYFDDADTTLGPERAADARHLDPRPATATMRQDPLTGEWISIAASRQNRVFLPPADQDPLAPATASNPSEVPSNYDVAVFENRSPSFGPDFGPVDTSGLGLGRTAPSHGRCEVVCFSPEHEGSFGSLSESRARTVIPAPATAMESVCRIVPCPCPASLHLYPAAGCAYKPFHHVEETSHSPNYPPGALRARAAGPRVLRRRTAAFPHRRISSRTLP
jgi:UDPglucose--hexose-1-phosphate uridylyltransferase